MRRLPLALAFLAALATSARAADTLPKVQTAAELRAVPVKHLPSGWDVRLAYADPGTDAGPWLLLYCDATFTAKATSLPAIEYAPHDALGPVSFSVKWDHAPAQAEIQEARHIARMKDGLFCALIPVHLGKCTLTISSGNQLLAEKELEFPDLPASPWQSFAQLIPGKGPTGETRAASTTTPAIPHLDPFAPLANLDQALAAGLDRTTTFRTAPLPGILPSDPHWHNDPVPPNNAPYFPLALSLQKDTFTLSSPNHDLIDMPDELLLARWWLNGKLMPPLPRQQALDHSARALKSTRSLAIAFGYPDTLASAKPDDKLTLQLLYTPAGYETKDAMQLDQAKSADEAPIPMLSNKLDITLTPELLALRQKNAQP